MRQETANQATVNQKKLDVKQIAVTGLMTAIICILAPFSLNIPISPVPISLGSMAIYFALTVLGRKLGCFSVALYILLGLTGLPVFTNFTGGAGKLFGPTGGYIIGFLPLALIMGSFIQHRKNNLIMHIVGAVLGTIVLYFFGTVWLGYQLDLDFISALWAGVIPYIPGDIIKLAIAMSIGMQLRKRLIAAGLL